MEGARGQGAPRGRWAAGPGAERAARSGPLGAALGQAWRGPGRSWTAASPRPAALAPPALAAVSPSFFPPPSVPKGKARSSPSPGAFLGPPPGPPRPGVGRPASGSNLRPAAGAGAEPAPARAGGRPPPREKAGFPLNGGVGRAGWCQKGCVFTAPRWPLRYTFESRVGRFFTAGGAPGHLQLSSRRPEPSARPDRPGG